MRVFTDCNTTGLRLPMTLKSFLLAFASRRAAETLPITNRENRSDVVSSARGIITAKRNGTHMFACWPSSAS